MRLTVLNIKGGKTLAQNRKNCSSVNSSIATTQMTRVIIRYLDPYAVKAQAIYDW